MGLGLQVLGPQAAPNPAGGRAVHPARGQCRFLAEGLTGWAQRRAGPCFPPSTPSRVLSSVHLPLPPFHLEFFHLILLLFPLPLLTDLTLGFRSRRPLTASCAPRQGSGGWLACEALRRLVGLSTEKFMAARAEKRGLVTGMWPGRCTLVPSSSLLQALLPGCPGTSRFPLFAASALEPADHGQARRRPSQPE